VTVTDLLPPEAFTDRLREEGSRRYHDQHPFHLRMHQGKLDKAELRRWVENRYYYQTRIPIKDALILSKSEDPAFRRMWIRRIRDHDGEAENSASGGEPTKGGGPTKGGESAKGGLWQWLKLAEGVGLDAEETAACRRVLPGVRFACDAYVELVRQSPLAVAVASSLTEMFAPDIMSKRIAAWREHYPWVAEESLAYFKGRVTRALTDGREGLAFVLREARSRETQEACVAALIKKTEVLWHMADCIQAGG
jgi:pyrroloquinoline-quinone synthase